MGKNTALLIGMLFTRLVNLVQILFNLIYREKNKKFAEQGAALAACVSLEIIDRETLIMDGSILE